jgi:uncharacterized membrane protein
MESRAKLLGHPIHQMLIVFPVGLLVTSVIFDILYLVTGTGFFRTASFYNIAAGVLGGLLAAIFGLIDYLAIPANTRAKRVGLTHGLGNVVVVVLFALSWFLRRDNEGFTPDTTALLLSLLGVGVATVTAWLGGELVDRLGVGVDPGANVNAPSSLTSESARPLAMEGIPVTGETREIDREPSTHGDLAKSSDEPEENTGKLIDDL